MNMLSEDISKEKVDTDSIAVMMGTHNHPEIVHEILKLSADYYKELGIDIYYFDSSTNDLTKKAVEEFIEKGYDNVYYVPVPGLNLHEKLDMMFKGEGLKKHYKYLWPSKDRCSYKRPFLEKILKTLEEDYDALLLLAGNHEEREYYSAIEFYHDWATWVTSVNVTIYNSDKLMTNLPYSDTLLKEEDWLFHFKHYYYFFYRLSKQENVRIKVLDGEEEINMLPTAKENNMLFVDVWKDRWIEVNEALPDYYNSEKEYVTKITAMLPWMISDRAKLQELHDAGILVEENLPKFLENWDKISNIPRDVIVKIAKGEYDAKYDLSQVQGHDQLIDNICSFAFLLREGLMQADSFPYEMAELAIKAVLARFDESDAREGLIKEAGESIWNEMDRRNLSSEELADHMQQLVAYLI